MSRSIGDRILKKLREAEGYLDLDLPRHTLRILESGTEWPGLQFEACLIKGEALRRLNRFREAIGPLETAASLRPSDSGVALALGWCYKRTKPPCTGHRLARSGSQEPSRQRPAAL